MRDIAYYLSWMMTEHAADRTDPRVVFAALMRELSKPRVAVTAPAVVTTAAGGARPGGLSGVSSIPKTSGKPGPIVFSKKVGSEGVTTAAKSKYSDPGYQFLMQRLLILIDQDSDLATILQELNNDPIFSETALDPNSELCHGLSAFISCYFSEIRHIPNKNIRNALILVRPFEPMLLMLLQSMTNKILQLPPGHDRRDLFKSFMQAFSSCLQLIDSTAIREAFLPRFNQIFRHIIKESADAPVDKYMLNIICEHSEYLDDNEKQLALPALRSNLARFPRSIDHLNILKVFNLLCPETIELFMRRFEMLVKPDSGDAKDSKEVKVLKSEKNDFIVDTALFIIKAACTVEDNPATLLAINQYLIKIFEHSLTTDETKNIIIRLIAVHDFILHLSSQIKQAMQVFLQAKLAKIKTPIATEDGAARGYINFCISAFSLLSAEDQEKLIALVAENLTTFISSRISRQNPQVEAAIRRAIQNCSEEEITKHLTSGGYSLGFIFMSLTLAQQRIHIAIILREQPKARQFFTAIMSSFGRDRLNDECRALLTQELTDFISSLAVRKDSAEYREELEDYRARMTPLSGLSAPSTQTAASQEMQVGIGSLMQDIFTTAGNDSHEMFTLAMASLVRLWDQINAQRVISILLDSMNGKIGLMGDVQAQGRGLVALLHLRAKKKFDPALVDQKAAGAAATNPEAVLSASNATVTTAATSAGACECLPVRTAFDATAEEVTKKLIARLGVLGGPKGDVRNTHNQDTELLVVLAQYWNGDQYLRYNALIQQRLLRNIDNTLSCWLLEVTIKIWHGNKHEEAWHNQLCELQMRELVEAVPEFVSVDPVKHILRLCL